MNQQRELIIRKINANYDSAVEESTDFEDEDDDDEEDAEMMELELDSGETLIVLNRDELIGDQLLIAEYSFGNVGNEPSAKTSRQENEFLNDSTVINYRPITPLNNLRQSQQFKNKQITPRDSLTPEKKFQNVKNSIDHFDRSNKNHNDNLKQGNLVNNRVKSSGMSQNRSQSIDKKPPYNHSLSAGNRGAGNENKSTNILVIESNDIPVEESYSTNASTTVGASRSFLANDSINGNGLQRQRSFRRVPEPNNSLVQRQKTNINNSVNIAPNPKYSITEPRPSSANSTKSKTSSSSSTINQESYYNNSNQKRNGTKN